MKLFPALMVVIFTVLAAVCLHSLFLQVDGHVPAAVASWRLIAGSVSGVLIAAFFLCAGIEKGTNELPK